VKNSISNKLNKLLNKSLNKFDIKQLLEFIFYSSTIILAIMVLAVSTIIIEKLSYDSQEALVNNIIEIETKSKSLTHTITSLIRRNTDIALSKNILALNNISPRKPLELKFNPDFKDLQLILTTDNDIVITKELDELYKSFLLTDSELFRKQQELINLNIKLKANNLNLEGRVQKIINAVDSAAGKIKLKAMRSRIKLSEDISKKKQLSTQKESLLLENLLGRQQRAENASYQIQLSALQIVQLSRKLNQTSNKDALISVRDNEISQEIRQINISLDILSANLKAFPDLMTDVSKVNTSLNQLVNILIKDEFSIYNLRTQYLDLDTYIELHLNKEVRKYANGMVKKLEELEDHLALIILKNKSNTEKISNLNYIIIIIISISILVIIFVNTILRTLRYRINRPLNLITNAVNDLTRGVLDSRLNSEKFAKDEFLSLANSFNIFAERNENLFNEVSSAHDEIQKKEQRLQAVFENTSAGIAHLVERRFISVNQRFEEMFGLDRDEIKGLLTEIFFLTQKEFEEVGAEAYPSFRSGGTYRGEYVLHRKDGSEFWCAISARSIEIGKPELGTIWLYDDISERIQQTAEIIEAKNEAEKANQLKSEFLANMSHELRTPMQSILGFSKRGIKQAEKASIEETIDRFQTINNNGTRLLSLLNDLLDLSKLEAGTVSLHLKNHDLLEIANSSIQSLSVLSDEKKLLISVESSVDDTKADIDSAKIQQVFLNLLSNAIKFSPEGSNIILKIEEATISVGRRASDTINKPALSISVIDQGMGIPDDELETVFDKFVQSSKTKTGAGGTGLGLAISSEIIKGHKGKLWAINNIDEPGTTFTITLPRKQNGT
jgi:PAS domain S-box-containing protein